VNHLGGVLPPLSHGLTGRSIGTLVPSPTAILRGAQFTGSRHSSGRIDLEELAQLV